MDLGLAIKKPLTYGEAWAGKKGGAILFALIFLVLFASRQKGHRDKTIRKILLHDSSSTFFLIKKWSKKSRLQKNS